jgi:hypothetical protein
MFPHITQYLITEEWNPWHLLLTPISPNYKGFWSFSLVGLCLVSLSFLVHMSAGFIASIPNTCTIYHSSRTLTVAVNKKIQLWCNSTQTFIHCKVTLHVSGITAPIIRSTKNVTATSGIGHNLGAAVSFQSGLIRPRWKEAAAPRLWPITEVAVTDFSTPDDGCGDARNMQSDFAVNKCLRTVASKLGLLIGIESQCTEPWI